MKNPTKTHSKKGIKILLITLLSIISVVIILCGGCLVFLLDCYHADTEAIEAFAVSNNTRHTTSGKYTIWEPDNATVGFIFYPGAKVEHEAYIPLMQECANEGILCVLVEMPLYFPLINQNAGEGIAEKYPNIKHWYIGGHSLGGYSASNYLADNLDKYAGLILLASYSSTDLSNSNLDVLSIYASEDKIINHERYKEGLSLLPPDYKEIVIDGGCHAYFGTYNGQDTTSATITNKEQLEITANAISSFIKNK